MTSQVKPEYMYEVPPISGSNTTNTGGEGEDGDATVLESNLLDEIMLCNGDRPDEGDAIFNSFIKTDKLEEPETLMDDTILFNGEQIPSFIDHGKIQTQESPLREPHQPPSPILNTVEYEKYCRELVDHSLVFGRNEPLHTIYVNPLDYLHIDENSLPYKLRILGLPAVSRVENQIKLEFRISPPLKECMIHLPTDCIARHKFYLEKDISTYPQEFQDQLLFAEAFLLCSSNDKTTYVCARCVKREHRRASRRKSGLSDNMLWCNNENRRAIIFNNKQVFVTKCPSPDCYYRKFELTARVVCYCRHHKSPDGFKILFVLKNSKGEVRAKTVSNNIMIMDKKPQLNSSESLSNTRTNNNNNNTNNNNNNNNSNSNDDNNNDNINNNDSNDIDTQSGLDTTAEMFSSANFSELPTTTTSASDNSISNHNIVGSNYIQNTSTINTNVDSSSGKYFSVDGLSPTADALEMINDNDSHCFNPSSSNSNASDHLISKGIIPSPTSMSEDGSESYLSRARTCGPLASSGSLYNHAKNYQRKRHRRNTSSIDDGDSATWSVSSAGILSTPRGLDQRRSSTNNSTSTAREQFPSMQRVIPSQGPINGGIEVTLLGSKFKEGLTVKFGENLALSTQCWSETTMVTCLPPAPCAGQVLVSVIDPAGPSRDFSSETGMGGQVAFTYVDDTDRQLIELALQIVGLKMNGKLEDARNIAKRIVSNDNSSSSVISPSMSTTSSNDNADGGSSIQNSFDNNKLMYSDENLLIKVIKSLHVNSNISMCDSLGRTLLQLASLKGYHALCSVLIKKGARVNDKDSFGFSPLHFACIGGDTKVIRLLLQCKADPAVRSHNGVSCKQLFLVNHATKTENYQYVEDVLNIFDSFCQPRSSSRLTRKLSDSSFNSSLYDTEFFDPLGRNGNHSSLQNFSSAAEEYSISDHEESELEEDGDEDLLAEDDPPTSPIATIHTRGMNVGNSLDRSNPNTQGMDRKLLNKILGYLNEGLPKYEDLYPNTRNDHGHKLSIIGRAGNIDRSASAAEESQNSSEDEEDALQLKLNRFFQQRQNFQNDKMLLFFWLPLTVVLLSWYTLFKFGEDGDYVHYFSNMVAEQLRVLLAKIILGNERMKAAFKEQLSMFQNTSILNVDAA